MQNPLTFFFLHNLFKRKYFQSLSIDIVEKAAEDSLYQIKENVSEFIFCHFFILLIFVLHFLSYLSYLI